MSDLAQKLKQKPFSSNYFDNKVEVNRPVQERFEIRLCDFWVWEGCGHGLHGYLFLETLMTAFNEALKFFLNGRQNYHGPKLKVLKYLHVFIKLQ